MPNPYPAAAQQREISRQIGRHIEMIGRIEQSRGIESEHAQALFGRLCRLLRVSIKCYRGNRGIDQGQGVKGREPEGVLHIVAVGTVGEGYSGVAQGVAEQIAAQVADQIRQFQVESRSGGDWIGVALGIGSGVGDSIDEEPGEGRDSQILWLNQVQHQTAGGNGPFTTIRKGDLTVGGVRQRRTRRRGNRILHVHLARNPAGAAFQYDLASASAGGRIITGARRRQIVERHLITISAVAVGVGQRDADR